MAGDLKASISKHDMSSLVCGLDIHKNSVYATVMSYGGEVVEKKLSNDEVVSFLDWYPIAKVAAARRLLMCCYSVLRNRQPYHDPESARLQSKGLSRHP